MRRAKSCHRETLAQGKLCKVEYCECGMLHVSLGPFTVRLEQEALRSIHWTFSDALGLLATRSRPKLRLVEDQEFPEATDGTAPPRPLVEESCQ